MFISKWSLRLTRRDLLAFGGSVLGVGAALLLTAVIGPLHSTPSVLFFGAVALTAWAGGKGPAILATLLSILAVDFFFVEPIFSALAGLADVVVFGAFIFVALLICYLQDSCQRTAAQLAQANVVLLERSAKLAAANESQIAEIEDRRRAEAALKESENKLRLSVGATEAALMQKEVLLRELQHRVKNNLQIISSLLSLHCGKLQDETSRLVFKECQQRIRAIALVHEKLYRAPDLARLDLAAYFQELVQNLLRCYSVNSGAVQTRIDVDATAVGIDHLIPCGLIVNELVCNALKHAFPDGRSGEVCVELRRRGGQVSLRVADDGVGGSLSEATRTSSVGHQIVKALVDQLAGKLEWSNGRGTSATVTFREMK